MSGWQQFVDTMTPERADLIRDFMVRMRTPEGIEETVSCLVAAIQMLSSEGGHELADRFSRPRHAAPGSEGGGE